MTELLWLNGETMPLGEGRISVEDRGFQFADGVYEVVRLYAGRPFALREHLDRLERSCEGISLALPIPRAQIAREIESYLPKAGVHEGMIYLQVTRGAAQRNHVFSQCRPTLLFYARTLPPVDRPGEAAGVKLWSVADERWKRCWIKSIALLPNVLAKNVAIAAGADEAVFVEDGFVSECAASNFYIIGGGNLITAPVGPKVLPGITRLFVIQAARELDIPVVERPISEAEAMAADELFITSTTREIGWVSRWNEKAVGLGKCGAMTHRLHESFQAIVRGQTG